MRTGLLVEWFEKLPQLDGRADPDAWSTRAQIALERFRNQAAERYGEGTLQRMVQGESATARRAAVMALGLIGTMDSNPLLAARLHDDDDGVRQYAADALWAVWFRGGSRAQNERLQRLSRARDPNKALAGLDKLSTEAPGFAEVYNQRAIVYFRRGEFARSAADCEQTLKLNSYHFGAQSGLAQCLVRLKKPRAALKAFQNALRINPNLEDVAESIRTLQDVLGEGGKDERK